jgi:ABC-type microcin C transport system permease subunit YejB
MRTILTSIAAILLLVTVAIAQVAPGAPVTCAALIKQFDDKTKIIQPTEEGKKLRDQAEADNKDNKEEDCNKNIKAAIKTLKK